MTGAVYTETTVFSPPEAYLNDAPYQLIIVTLDQGGRVTARVLGDAVRIGDRVVLAEQRDGVPYFKKA
jgi:uncharacterized OB-fold protein